MTSANFGVRPYDKIENYVFSLSVNGDKIQFTKVEGRNLKQTLENVQQFVDNVRKNPQVKLLKDQVEVLQAFCEGLRSGEYFGVRVDFDQVRILRTHVQFQEILSKKSEDLEVLKNLRELINGQYYQTIIQSALFEEAQKRFFELTIQLFERVQKWESTDVASFTEMDLQTYYDQRQLLNLCLSTAEALIDSYKRHVDNITEQMSRVSIGTPVAPAPKPPEPALNKEAIQKMRGSLRNALYELLGETQGKKPENVQEILQFRQRLEAIREKSKPGKETVDALSAVLKEAPKIVDTDKALHKMLCDNMRLACIQAAGTPTLQQIAQSSLAYSITEEQARALLQNKRWMWIYNREAGKEYIYEHEGHGVVLRLELNQAKKMQFKDYLPPLQAALQFHPLSSGKISSASAQTKIEAAPKDGTWLLRYTSRNEWVPFASGEVLNREGAFPNSMSLEDALTSKEYPLSKCIQEK